MENLIVKFLKPLEIIGLKFVQNLMKMIKLLFLSLFLSGCVWDAYKDCEVEYVNVEKIEVYKKYDPVTQSNWPVYIAICHIDGKEEKIRVQSNKVKVIKVYKKIPSQTP
jgi:hypothetical protein